MGQINTNNYPTVDSLADADLLIVENATHGTGTTTPKQLRENAIGTDTLQTSSQTVTGAINELKGAIDDNYALAGSGMMTGYSAGVIDTNICLNREPKVGDRLLILFTQTFTESTPIKIYEESGGTAYTLAFDMWSSDYVLKGLCLVKVVDFLGNLALRWVYSYSGTDYQAGQYIGIDGEYINNTAPQLGDNSEYHEKNSEITDGNLGTYGYYAKYIIINFRARAVPNGTTGKYSLQLSRGAALEDASLVDRDGNDFTAPIKAGVILLCSVDHSNDIVTVLNNDIVANGDIKDGQGNNLASVGTVVNAAYKLISNTPVAESVPYLYRRSGGAVRDVALENLKKVIGASVAWNQVAYDNLSFSGQGITITNTNGIIDIDGTATGTVYVRLTNDSDKPIDNHVYYVSTQNKQSGVVVYNNNNGITTNNKTVVIGKDVQGAEAQNWYLRIAAGTVCQHLKMAIIIIDLTQMLGSAIADYLYSLEQATDGSGIAKLKEWGFFTKDYYAYNAGALQSVKTSGKKCVGKNQAILSADEISSNQYETHSFSDSGVEVSASGNYGRLGFSLSVKKGTTYTLSLKGFSNGDYNKIYLNNSVSWGSPSYTMLSLTGSLASHTYTFTATTDILFVGCYVTSNSSTSGVMHIEDFQLEFGTTATTYEPYTEKTYLLSNVELRGLFKLDSNNNLYADGDEYTPDGNVKRKYGIVDLGSLSWTYRSEDGMIFSEAVADMKGNVPISSKANILCGIYLTVTRENMFSGDREVSINAAAQPSICVNDSRYTDAETFKTAMNGVYLIYELATPTTDTTTPYAETMAVESDGTEEFIDTRDVSVPVGHYSEYWQKVAGLPTAPTTDGTYRLICTVSNGVPTFSWAAN